jgi:group I intron endonuclease
MTTSIVYMAVNKIDGKMYIGVTSKSMEERKYRHQYVANRGSKHHFHRALKKYGNEEFTWTVIEEFQTYKEASNAEMLYISEYRKTNILYNMTDGGDGFRGVVFSKEARKKMSLAKIGKPNHWSNGKMPQALRDKYAALRRSENRIITEKHKISFRINAKKANAKRRRPIICISDNLYYPSSTSAAKSYGLTTGQISHYCSTNCVSRRGLQFGYADKVIA